MELQGLLQACLLPFEVVSQEVRVVPELIALLADQVEGVVMVGCELVPVQNHHLSLPYQLLQGKGHNALHTDTNRAKVSTRTSGHCHLTKPQHTWR